MKDPLHWPTESLQEIYGPRLKRLILFGSQARGEAGPKSDMDVLVVLEGPTGAYEEARRTSRVATEAAAYRDTVLSFVHMGEAEFARDRSPLVWSVREDGIDLQVPFLRQLTLTHQLERTPARHFPFGVLSFPPLNRHCSSWTARFLSSIRRIPLAVVCSRLSASCS